MVNLSKRMEAIVSLIGDNARVCDVGCDHGFVSIALIERGIASGAVLMDVNKGPLARAKENAALYGVADKCNFILSDGLAKYTKGLANTLIIAGMGGPLIQRILIEGGDKISDFDTMVLSPQSEIKEFRIFLSEKGFVITDEDMVFEDGKFYQIIKVGKTKNNNIMLTKAEASYGPVLLKKKHKVLKEFLLKEREKNDILLCKLGSLSENNDIKNRIADIKAELSDIELALSCVGQD